MLHEFTSETYAHVYNRGTKKLPIQRHENDFLRLLLNLYYLNHTERAKEHWMRELIKAGNPNSYIWPPEWGDKQQLVAILAYALMPNHLHLLLKELQPGGISKFMHRISTGYTKFINEKYDENGHLFQGRYRGRDITDDFDFRYAAVYIMVKNPFELYPGGLKHAIANFDDAYEFAAQSQFNSLANYTGSRNSPIINKDLLGELFPTPQSFKEFARECMLYKLDQIEAIARATNL